MTHFHNHIALFPINALELTSTYFEKIKGGEREREREGEKSMLEKNTD